MPNVSASLSEDAYEVWRKYEGNRSRWISNLVEEYQTYPQRVEALNRRVDFLSGLLADSFAMINAFRGGSVGEITDQHAVLLQNKILEQLDGTLHYYNATRESYSP